MFNRDAIMYDNVIEILFDENLILRARIPEPCGMRFILGNCDTTYLHRKLQLHEKSVNLFRRTRYTRRRKSCFQPRVSQPRVSQRLYISFKELKNLCNIACDKLLF